MTNTKNYATLYYIRVKISYSIVFTKSMGMCNMRVYRTPRGQRYFFTLHALKRFKQKRIRQEDLEDAIDHYDKSDYDTEGNIRLIRALTDGRSLRIHIARDSNPSGIITIIII